jgi:F-type H+-transporting ATPase subunit delta
MKTSVLSAEIVEPYAQALMSVAQTNNQIDQLGEDIRYLVSLMENSPELRAFVANPIVKEADKKSVLRQVVGGNTNQFLINFLMLLVDKRRIVFLGAICQKYLELLRKLKNTVLAEVTSTTELSAEQQHSVIEKVRAITNAQAVEIKNNVDPSIIGGVIIKVGSQVFDSSLQGQLRRISLNLSGAK